MEMQSFEKRRVFMVLVVLVLSVLLLFGVHNAMAGPEDAPSAALYAITWNAAGITADTNSTAYLTQHYAYHDLFCDIDHHAAGGVTITVQSSPAGTTYYDTYVLVQSEATQDVYTRVLSYGRYERLEFDVNDTALITPTCRSVYFNNWTPAAYCQQKE